MADMWEQLLQWLTADLIWPKLVWIGVYFLIAWGIHRLAYRIAGPLLRFAPRRYRLRPERQETVRGLTASAVSFIAFVAAFLFSLGLFVVTDTLIWMIGLFSAAFGLGARPLIADYLTGVSFLLEDQFDVGEKVEILGVEGVVEEVNLRTMTLRSPTGEMYVVPNGEVRVVRNFSRGRFSTANINLKIAAEDLNRALNLLEKVGEEAVYLLPNLLEPWQVISESGAIGQQTDLTLITKTRFGKAAEMRPRLLALVQERLEEAEINLVG